MPLDDYNACNFIILTFPGHKKKITHLLRTTPIVIARDLYINLRKTYFVDVIKGTIGDFAKA